MCDFKWSRFVAALRWDYELSKRTFLRKFIALFFSSMLIIYLFRFAGNVGFYVFFLSAVAIFGVSKAFASLKMKQHYVSYLMVPASNMEKFVVKWVLYTVVWVVMALLAFALADVALLLLSKVFGAWGFSSQEQIPTIAEIWRNLQAGGCFSVSSLVPFVIIVVWMHSIYLLGGLFFRRNATLFTTIVCFAVSVLILIIIAKFVASVDWDVYEVNRVVARWYLIIGCSFFTILNYFLSYRIFKRLQVIAPKWVNV